MTVKRIRRIKQLVAYSLFMRDPLPLIFIDPMRDSALMAEIGARCRVAGKEQDLLVLGEKELHGHTFIMGRTADGMRGRN